MGWFEQETAVEQVTERRWRGEIHRGWRIGEVANGGYVLAIAGRALAKALPHRDPLSVNAFYLAPVALGPIECDIDILREGRSTSWATAKLSQNGELKVQVTAAYTDLYQLDGPDWCHVARPEYPAWDDCMAGSASLEFTERVEVRLAQGGEVFVDGRPSGRGEYAGWVAHRDGSHPDPIGLLMFADAFPPPALDIVGLIGWVPTIELTVQVRARPTPGPVQVHLQSRFLTAGIVEEDGEYWDSAGRLVAVSRQTAKVRVPKAGQTL
ncbi:MAG: thioesterase family protein [Parahaliea sp.]